MGLIDDSGFERHGTTWRDLAAMLFGRRRIIIAIILGTILGTYATLALITERYESTATLLVKLGRENTEIPLTAQNTGFVATGLRKEGINSEIQILTSRSLVEETVDELGADLFRSSLQRPESLLGYPRYIIKTCVRWSKKQGRSALIALNLKKKISEREAAIQLIAGALRVEPMKDSDVIAVSVRIADPALCVKVLDTILEFYLEHHVRAWRTPQARDFFAMQLEANQQTLEELGDLRETVRSKWNLVSVDEQRTMLLQQLADIDGQFELNEAEIADLRAQKASMLRRLEEIPERVSATEIQTQNPSIPSIKERLTSLELERAKIVTRYKPGAEPVKMVEAEIAQLERILETEEPTLLGSVSSETNPVRQTFLRSIEQMHIRILGLEERNRTLLEPIVDIRRRLAGLSVGQDKFESVERDYGIAEEKYATYAKRLEEARISEELDVSRASNVSILSPPSSPIEPVYPRKLLIMMVAIAIGPMLGVGSVLLMHYVDDTIRSPTDVANVADLRVLGTYRASGGSNRPSRD